MTEEQEDLADILTALTLIGLNVLKNNVAPDTRREAINYICERWTRDLVDNAQ